MVYGVGVASLLRHPYPGAFVKLRNFALCLPLLLLAACGPSPEEVVEEYRPRLEDHIKKMDAVARKAIANTSAQGAPAADVRLTFGNGGNARIVHAERFDDDPAFKPELDLILSDFWLTLVQDSLKGSPIEDSDGMRAAAEEVLAVKYLIVVRTLSKSEPVVMGESSFAGGSWDAELYVCDVAKGELLGGWTVSSKNDEKVEVNLDKIESWLHSNLWSNSRKAVNEALAKNATNVPLS